MIYRTNKEFQQTLLKGLQVEEDFAKKVALMGGHATPFGPPPVKQKNEGCQTPLTCFTNGDGQVSYFTSPDLMVDFPNFAGKVQLKAKKIQKAGTEDAHFLLDQKEKDLMEQANLMALPTLFVVYCEDLKFRPNLDAFSFVDVADLHPDLNHLRRRTVQGKHAFVLPLRLFRSFSTQNINRLGKTYYDFEGRRDAYRTGTDPADVGQLRTGPNESSSSAGNPHHHVVA